MKWSLYSYFSNFQIPYIVTDTKPLEPYGDAEATKDVALPDISPLNPFVCLWPQQVYNPDRNFPIKVSLLKDFGYLGFDSPRLKLSHICL